MKIKGLLTFSTVLCNTVQNRVEDDKHTDRHKLLAEVKNVITDKSVIRINIGWLCKGIQRTVSKQLDSKGDSFASGSSCFKSSARKSCKVGTVPVYPLC